jgi:hypothetical protein
MFRRGILTLGLHNMSYAHSDEDIALLLKAYTEVFAIISQALASSDLEAKLDCAPLEPLFRVR